MADIINKQIDNLNDKLCQLYPDDTDKCKTGTNKYRLKIVFYIAMILLGVVMMIKGPDIITKLVSNFIKGFNGLIALTLIAFGGLSLINI